MASVDGDGLRAKMLARGVTAEEIDQRIPDMTYWVGAFSHPRENVQRVVQVLRDNPLLPKDVPVHGLLFCPNDGRLELVASGYDR